ncbi:MAG TPA: PDC sensor domain-containing protein [Chitinispirillaceae bacterium]|nr:PDC sensor domain-containing protein [Chitinispirillaceae bacterium]
MHRNNYRFILLVLLCHFYSIGNSAVSGLGDCFKELHKRLSVQATSRIASLSIDSTDDVFNTLLKNNSPVIKVFRANSNGIIINESTRENANHVMRNVSGQKWFIEVSKTMRPYYGVTRDSIGPVFLFWVYPLQSTAGQFAGALAAKIDPAEAVRYVEELKPVSLKLEINDKTVFTNNWHNPQNVESISWNISEALVITGYYNHPNGKAAKPEKETQSKALAADSSKPVKSDVAVFSAKVDVNKKHAKRSFWGSFLLIILLSSLIVAIFFRIGKRWHFPILRTGLNEKCKNKEVCCQGGFDEVMDLVEDNLPNEKNDYQTASQTEKTDDLTNRSSKATEEKKEEKKLSLEPEKKEVVSPELFYNQKKDDIFKKAQLHFKPVQSLDQSNSKTTGIRDEIYREIHGQMIHWVVCETARLSNCLDELTVRINRLEGTGESPELESIREDALKISREIDIFRNSFSDS